MSQSRKSFVKDALLIAIMVAVVAGCGNDDKGTESKSAVPQQLLGTWTLQSVSLGGSELSIDTVLPWEPSAVVARITVNSDETFVYDNLSADSSVVLETSGAFTATDNTFSLTDGASILLSGNWAVAGTRLTLSSDIEGYQLVIVASR